MFFTEVTLYYKIRYRNAFNKHVGDLFEKTYT